MHAKDDPTGRHKGCTVEHHNDCKRHKGQEGTELRTEMVVT